MVGDDALEPQPELAERWEQRSPTEYVFHLRRGVRFHNVVSPIIIQTAVASPTGS